MPLNWLKICRTSSPILARSLKVGTTMSVRFIAAWPSASEVMGAERLGRSSHLISVGEKDRAKRKQPDRERQKRLVKPGPPGRRQRQHQMQWKKNAHIAR